MKSGDRLAHFELLEPIGAGGMGRVWRARDGKLKRDVALKLLPEALAADSTALARARREAELMAAVGHPNVAGIYSLERDVVEGRPVQFLVLELVPGHTLQTRLRSAPMGVSEALAVAAQIAAALHAAHERGVVHRDLKPANVMLGPDGVVKVLDFGIARVSDAPAQALDIQADAPTVVDATATGALVGTAPYMSPEQVRGLKSDHRADLWALACTLYEMLTGTRAFAGDTPADILTAVLGEDPRWDRLPPSLPPAIRRMLQECLRKEPDQRTWTAAEARRTLDAGAAMEPPVPERFSGGRGLARAAAAAVLLIGGVLAISRLADFSTAPEMDLSGVGSVVALPATLEGDPDPLFHGTHESLTTGLVGVQGLTVKAPPTDLEVREFADLRRLADEYHVDALLLSTVSRGPEGLQLRVRLMDPYTRGLLWGHEYISAGEAPGVLIRTAAIGIREALRPGVVGAPPRRATTPEAQLQLDYGRAYSQRYNFGGEEDDYRRAREALELALDEDPGLAAAAAELSFLAQYRLQSGDESARQQVGQWAQLAVDLDPGSGIAWGAQSIWAFHRTGSWREALGPALRGASLAPGDARAHQALGIWMAPSATLALLPLQRARELDPLQLSVRNLLGTILLVQGAEPLQSVTPHLEYPRRMQPENGAFQALALLGRVRANDRAGAQQALELVRAASKKVPPAIDATLGALVQLHVGLGEAREENVEAALQTLQELTPTLPFFYAPEIVIEAVALLARHGRVAAAADLLAASVANPQLLLPWDVYHDRPDLEPLRGNPAWRQAVETSRAELDRLVSALQESLERGELPPYLEAPFVQLRDRLERVEDRAAV